MNPRLELSLDDVIGIFYGYALGIPQSAHLIPKGYNNANFKVVTEQGNFLLKVYLEGDLTQIQSKSGLLKKLKECNFPAAYPISNLKQEDVSISPFGPLVVFNFIEGTEPQINHFSIKAAAHTVSELNSIINIEGVHCPNHRNWAWCQAFAASLGGITIDLQDMLDYFQLYTAFFTETMNQPLPKGIIHGDVYPDNTILMKNGRLALIDFEAASVEHLLIDAGSAINGFCFQENRIDLDMLKIFLIQYQKTRILSPLEIELLSHYIMWGAHFIIGWHIKLLLEREKRNPLQVSRIYYLIERVKNLRKSLPEIEGVIRSLKVQIR